MFLMTTESINVAAIPSDLKNKKNGAVVTFDGLVRDHNEGKAVKSLEYDCYTEMAQVVGEKIIAEAKKLFSINDIYAVHRYGHLQIGDVAVVVAAASAHRKEAFLACQYVIDEVKLRVPIWKKEHYVNAPSEWVACHQCSAVIAHQHGKHCQHGEEHF